jgi:hypothetical protein
MRKIKIINSDFYIWFSVCNPNYRKRIKDLYFTFGL